MIGVTAFWGSNDTGKVRQRVLPSMFFVVVWIDVKLCMFVTCKVIIIGHKIYFVTSCVKCFLFVCCCFLSSVP